MLIRKIHHVAYRCINAKQTVHWYGKYLKMGFVLAIAEDQVPSTGEADPYMHVFLDAGAGNILAFFELPTRAPMGRDPNTPVWVQHLALEVATVADLLEVKARLQADGIEVVGPTDHKLFQSIYFFDPSGHRVELAAVVVSAAMAQRLDEVKWQMLDEFDLSKRAPRHASWLHDGGDAKP
jgi:catechol 2,3-dioxygenase-like lactoylglutathione lyase family enzyme